MQANLMQKIMLSLILYSCTLSASSFTSGPLENTGAGQQVYTLGGSTTLNPPGGYVSAYFNLSAGLTDILELRSGLRLSGDPEFLQFYASLGHSLKLLTINALHFYVQSLISFNLNLLNYNFFDTMQARITILTTKRIAAFQFYLALYNAVYPNPIYINLKLIPGLKYLLNEFVFLRAEYIIYYDIGQESIWDHQILFGYGLTDTVFLAGKMCATLQLPSGHKDSINLSTIQVEVHLKF